MTIEIPVQDGAEATDGYWTWRLTGAEARLVSIAVVSGATQKNVEGAKNWATVNHPTDEVIVQATTKPNTMAAWEKIRWSGDSGTPIPGRPQQRKLSRSNSQVYHVKASLGGVNDVLNVWILSAQVSILTTGTVPKNSAKFGPLFDGTEKLSAVFYDDGNAAAGKIAAIAKITPKGVHNVIKSGWKFRRELEGIRFENGIPNPKWKSWTNDTSKPELLKLTPDSDDAIYDIDAPTIGGASWNDTNEAYINFRQWVEWNNEKCSDYAYWYWQARWKFVASPKVTLKEVGLGVKPIPDKSFFNP